MDDAAMMDAGGDEAAATPPVRELTKGQRRVLGVLIEKAITTPEYYPLTLKAVVSGCNQKRNRDPVVNYSEDAAEEYLNELRELGLVACVHTGTGRTERFRHYMRMRYPFNEPQLAIMAELLLRGRQQLGELRSRASRMAIIDSQDDLRTELTALQEMGYLQATGSLDRRGIEVDHNFYPAREGRTLEARGEDDDERAAAGSSTGKAASARAESASSQVASEAARIAALEEAVAQLRTDRAEQVAELQELQSRFDGLVSDMDQLRRDLGG